MEDYHDPASPHLHHEVVPRLPRGFKAEVRCMRSYQAHEVDVEIPSAAQGIR